MQTFVVLVTSALFLPLLSCSHQPEADTLVMIIESSPTNLDPRVGLDAQSERIDGLLFDNLLARDEHLSVQPGLAERWEIPDPKTYIFHLHPEVKFSDGRPLTARDVKWSFDSLLQGKVRSTKASTYRFVDHIDTPDDRTVIFHLKEPWAALLWNVAGGAGMGIVPYGSGSEASQQPIGSGPFRFVRAEQDKEVVIERNDNYWGKKRRFHGCDSSWCLTQLHELWNSAKEARTWPLTRCLPIWCSPWKVSRGCALFADQGRS